MNATNVDHGGCFATPLSSRRLILIGVVDSPISSTCCINGWMGYTSENNGVRDLCLCNCGLKIMIYNGEN